MSRQLDDPEDRNAEKHPSGLDIRDELARTYFSAPRPNKKSEKKKDGLKQLLPWIITAAVIVTAALIVLSRSSIDVNVRLLGEVPTFKMSGGTSAVEKGDFLVKGGQAQRGTVKNAYFAGDGKQYSLAKEDELKLINARGAGWANFTVELKEPVDLNRLDVKYTAKGARGGESLVLVIVDTNNRIYRMEKDLSSSLSDDWQQYAVNFRPVKRSVDLSNIKTIKFEFGSLTADNYSGALIYLKDVYLAKTRGFKWL
jgi:hypothetical protein